MFGLSRIKRRLDYQEQEIERVKNNYWELQLAHNRLLRHLKLTEHEVSSYIEIRSVDEDKNRKGPGST